MKSIDTLKEQLKDLLDKTTDKEMIQTLTTINGTIQSIEADTTALEKDNRELLDDYKEMVKHTSFKVESEPSRGAAEPPKFEDFLAQAAAKK